MLLATFEAAVSEQLLQGGQIRDLAREFAVALDPLLIDALPLVFNKAILYEIFGDRETAPAPRADVAARIMTLEHEMANALGAHSALVMFDEAVDRSVVAGALDALRVDALSVLSWGMADLARGPAAGRIAPVILTRPELFSRLSDRERHRWRGERLDLSWTSHELQMLAGYRIARARNHHATAKQAEPALQSFFEHASRRLGASQNAAWRFIWSRTRARPRDVVFFIRAAARNARHRALDHIDGEALVLAERTYAAFLLQDMADEARDAAPDVDHILGAIARHGKTRMTASELVDVIEHALKDAGSDEGVAGARVAIERLFAASAIGNWVGGPRHGRARFAHDDVTSTLSYAEPLIVHLGLASALELELEDAA